jgi:hypothetical protein
MKSEDPKTPAARMERMPPDGIIISEIMTTTPTSWRMIGSMRMLFVIGFL